MVVAEGARCAPLLPERLATADVGFTVRATRLGHVQRGGAPGVFDRLLGTRLGAAAVQECGAGRGGVMVAVQRGNIVATPLADALATPRGIDTTLLDLAR